VDHIDTAQYYGAGTVNEQRLEQEK